MLDQLIGLVKQYAGDAIVKNPDIPNEKNEEAMAEASNTVVGGLQNILAGGGLQSIMNLFSQGNKGGTAGLMQNPIVNMMAGHFMKKLMGKFGINSGAASNIATSLIPSVLNGLISKTQDPNDKSVDMNSIIRSLTGGNAPVAEPQQSGGGGFDFQDLLNKFTGGGGSNAGGGGGFDIGDIISKVTKGAQQNQESQSSGGGGGIMDMIKGFLK
ncbi:MAG: hypothetical protein RIR12_957 [Bacteroidota bacterium]|jgi:hypothetical protein